MVPGTFVRWLEPLKGGLGTSAVDVKGFVVHRGRLMSYMDMQCTCMSGYDAKDGCQNVGM